MKMIFYSVSLIAIFLLVSCESEPSEEEVTNANTEQGAQEPPNSNEQSEYATTDETAPAPVKKPSEVYVNTPPPIEKVKNCDQAAQAVFLSVKDVQDYLSEPDVTYVFEYKPGDEGNPNGRYWFWIFSARQGFNATETYARYQVDPQTLEVYEYDALEDKAIPIMHDSKLRKEVRKFCAK